MSLRTYLRILVSIARLKGWLTDQNKTQRQLKESVNRGKKTKGVMKEKQDVVRMKKISDVKMKLTDRCLRRSTVTKNVSISAKNALWIERRDKKINEGSSGKSMRNAWRLRLRKVRTLTAKNPPSTTHTKAQEDITMKLKSLLYPYLGLLSQTLRIMMMRTITTLLPLSMAIMLIKMRMTSYHAPSKTSRKSLRRNSL